MRAKLLFCCALLAAAGLARALAAEKEIDRNELPQPVTLAVEKHYPGAKIKRVERIERKNGPVYEIRLNHRKKKLSVHFKQDGQVLSERENISEADVPAAVKAGVKASAYAGWKVLKVRRVIKPGKFDQPRYGYLLTQGNERLNLVLDQEGKILVSRRKKAPRED